MAEELLRRRLFRARRAAHYGTATRQAIDHRGRVPHFRRPTNEANRLAHHINNPLSYVTANVDVAIEEVCALRGGATLAQIDKVEEMLHDARDGAARVTKIIRGLQPSSIDVAEAGLLPDQSGEQLSPIPASVLVVDDERPVADAIRRVLHDHDVTIATTGRAALGILDGGHDFDVMLCDLMMPRMSGMELYAALLAWHPEMAARVAFLTGGAYTREATDFLAHVPNCRLEKPFAARALRALVLSSLDARLRERALHRRSGQP